MFSSFGRRGVRKFGYKLKASVVRNKNKDSRNAGGDYQEAVRKGGLPLPKPHVRGQIIKQKRNNTNNDCDDLDRYNNRFTPLRDDISDREML